MMGDLLRRVSGPCERTRIRTQQIAAHSTVRSINEVRSVIRGHQGTKVLCGTATCHGTRVRVDFDIELWLELGRAVHKAVHKAVPHGGPLCTIYQ